MSVSSAMIRPITFSLALTAFFIGALAGAQKVQIGQPEFEAGRTYYEAQKYERALESFQKSYALSKKPALFYNYALCYDKLGNPHRALEFLDRYLANVDKVDGRAQIEAYRVGLQRRINAANVPAPAWLLIPTGLATADRTWFGPTVEALRERLQSRGQSTWNTSTAADRFETLGSAPAPEISQGDIDRWVARSRNAVKYLARADYDRAHRELKHAQDVADEAAAELNREAARARQVLDTCLYMVRAYVETGDDTEARNRARACRQLVPSVEPSAYRHTPEVRDLLRVVDREMATELPGRLEVTSEPDACVARLNGIDFGPTPLGRDDLPVGTYRLQVECDPEQRARVHRITVRAGTTKVHVNTEFDRTIRSRPQLHLVYANAEVQNRRRANHADQVAQVLDAGAWLLLSQPEPGVLRIDARQRNNRKARTSAWLKLNNGKPDAAALDAAIDALISQSSLDLTGEAAVERSAWVGPEEGTSLFETPRGRKRVIGYTLGALSLAAYGVSTAMFFRRAKLGDDYASIDGNNLPNRATDWKNARTPIWASAGSGAVLGIAALPLVLPNKNKTPWWAWLSGGVGLGLAGYAGYEVATRPSASGCREVAGTLGGAAACVARHKAGDRAFLAGAGAAPLITVPLVYLFRPKRLTPKLDIQPGHAIVGLEGSF